VALNKLWRLNLPKEDLAAIGLKLGADVPFFIHGHTAWAEGIGEKLQSFSTEEPWYLLVHPGIHISTAEIFSNSQLTRDTTPIRMHSFIVGDGHNDCEPVVRSNYPEVEKVFDWFGSDSQARLTGTGACVFCPYPDESTAREVARSLPEHWSGYVVKGLNRSPLLDRLAREPEG
jgi:4-diphosphocytidyl-2-C-methyl-D-erythritol kinase